MKKEIKNLHLSISNNPRFCPFNIKIQNKDIEDYELKLGEYCFTNQIEINQKKANIHIDLQSGLSKYLDLKYIFHSPNLKLYQEYSFKIHCTVDPGCFIIGKRINQLLAQEIIDTKDSLFIHKEYSALSSIHSSGHIWFCSDLYKDITLDEIIFELMKLCIQYPTLEFIVNLFEFQIYYNWVPIDEMTAEEKKDFYRTPLFGIHHYNGKFELIDSLQSQIITEKFLNDTNNIIFNKPMSFFEAINTIR